jgi:hypothetical protein
VTGGKGKKDAVRRLFLVAADVQKSEGVTIDGRDPAWRRLCDSPDLADMTEEEMRERLIALTKLATELEC